MAMSAETKARRAADRKREKELSKLIPVADFVKVTNEQEGRITVKVDCVELSGKVEFVNSALERLGYRPVRLTRNILNPRAGFFAIDINTPSYLDPGSEAYHSM